MTKKPSAKGRFVPSERSRQPLPPTIDGKTMKTVEHTLPQGWHQHPQQVRPHQRFAPYGQPPHLGNADQGNAGYPVYYDSNGNPQQPVPHVEVNNNGQFYRPWKEELALAFGKNIGNFFAWPLRLVGGIVEGIINAGLGIVKLVLIAVIAPTLIYTGMEMYQASQQGESATAAAAEVGKDAIGLMGAVLGGMWDGVFGSDDEAPAQ